MTQYLRRRFPIARLFAACVLCLSFVTLQAEEAFAKVKDIKGRSLSVQIIKVEGGQVTFNTRQGKTYTKPLATFSVQDQLKLKKWKPSKNKTNPVIEDSKLQLKSSSDGQTVFCSKHFEFQIFGAAKVDQANAFAPVFEATYWAFEKLPIQLTPVPSRSHFVVKIYPTESDFEVASREKLEEGQAALYNLDQDVLLAPLEKLKPGEALVKEIGFALLGKRLATMPPWMAVALSEYLAAAPLQNQALNLDKPLANVTKRLKEVYSLTDKTIPMLAPGAVLELDYDTLRKAGLNGEKSRSSSLLMLYYLGHLDGKGKAKNLQDYWRAIRINATAEESAEALLGGRSPDKLQDDMRVAYITKKLRVAFIQ